MQLAEAAETQGLGRRNQRGRRETAKTQTAFRGREDERSMCTIN